MDAKYLQERLRASLEMADAASDAPSRIAHQGLARGYRKALDLAVDAASPANDAALAVPARDAATRSPSAR
jgi:hypothetical protein